MENLRVNVAREFSVTPGPRFRAEGDYSGEQFRLQFLEPRLRAALEEGVKLVVSLDGTAGYATSFLEEAFGGLARLFGPEIVNSTLEFESREEPYLIAEIRDYIEHAAEEQQ